MEKGQFDKKQIFTYNTSRKQITEANQTGEAKDARSNFHYPPAFNNKSKNYQYGRSRQRLC